jgi:dTDP-glucose 4,6-dehydratase
LPLDAHFAIGNFIRDALHGGPIIVQGDGTARRSYLYAGELTSWLLHLLLRGRPGCAYNVGSEHDVSIRELASMVAGDYGLRYEIRRLADPTGAVDRYVPSTVRIRRELGLSEKLDLSESIRRTMLWHQQEAAR